MSLLIFILSLWTFYSYLNFLLFSVFFTFLIFYLLIFYTSVFFHFASTPFSFNVLISCVKIKHQNLFLKILQVQTQYFSKKPKYYQLIYSNQFIKMKSQQIPQILNFHQLLNQFKLYLNELDFWNYNHQDRQYPCQKSYNIFIYHHMSVFHFIF